jgi:hypothetical protein
MRKITEKSESSPVQSEHWDEIPEQCQTQSFFAYRKRWSMNWMFLISTSGNFISLTQNFIINVAWFNCHYLCHVQTIIFWRYVVLHCLSLFVLLMLSVSQIEETKCYYIASFLVAPCCTRTSLFAFFWTMLFPPFTRSLFTVAFILWLALLLYKQIQNLSSATRAHGLQWGIHHTDS